VANRCGGCSFRHLSYAAELNAKQHFVQDALLHIGHIEAPVRPILPSPLENRYRNKVQYPVQPGRDGALVYGFYAPRSHQVVPCDDCLLQNQRLNQIAAATAALLQQAGAQPYHETTRQGLVRHIYLRQSNATGDVLLCLVLTSSQLPGAEQLVAELPAAFPEIKTIVLNLNPDNTNVVTGAESITLYGGGVIHDVLAGVPMRLGVHTFAQVNTPAAERLFGALKHYAAPKADDVLLDLYCGAGVIGLSMGTTAGQVLGVDTVPQSIESARLNAREMGLANTRFLCEDAQTAAERLAREGLRPDIVTLDPPRKGVDAATLQAVCAMAPPRLVMISCNPATLARDLALLCQNGYTVQAVQPVDMFPRTRHVECVVLLTKAAP